MSNQPRPHQRGPLAAGFGRDEWELLVTLPRRVLVTAAAAEPLEARGAAEGIAGIEAIASGLASPSPLVREVVGSIYSESHGEPEGLLGDSDSMLQTLAACRFAAEVLSNRASEQDAEAYRNWLCHIAAVVTGVAQGVSGTAPTSRGLLLESPFLYALGGVLRP